MARTLQLNIDLEQVIDYDSKADMYVIWYKEFPQAFAEGKTVEEAEENLIPALELLWRKRPELTQ